MARISHKGRNVRHGSLRFILDRICSRAPMSLQRLRRRATGYRSWQKDWRGVTKGYDDYQDKLARLYPEDE